MLTKLVKDIQNILEYHQLMGIKEIPYPKTKSKTKVETKTLEELRIQLEDCKKCKLCNKRTNVVFGIGNPSAKIMFVGEGPGRDEDIQGIPFVGLAGQLLTKIIQAMGYKREEVYIANVVKCRPPQNRNPEPDEINTCFPFLEQQIVAINPKVIICLGKIAAHILLKTQKPITKLRGNFENYKNIPVMPTFHPAYLLRNPDAKHLVWKDVQKVMEILKK